MKRTSAEYRAIARQNLNGKWTEALIATLLAWFLGASVYSSYTASVDLDSAAFKEAFEYLLPLILVVTLIGNVLNVFRFVVGGAATLGYAKYHLNLHDKQPANVRDVHSCFDRLGAAFVMSFLRNIFVFLWSLLLLIPGIVKSISYAMAPYILLENPNMTGLEAITASKTMMDGEKWDYFVLDFSFIGWSLLASVPSLVSAVLFEMGKWSAWPIILLGALASFAASLLVGAYKSAAQAAFYRDLLARQIPFSTPMQY